MPKEIFLKDGDLTGLPDAYLPAHFDTKSYILTIAEKGFRFPDFLVDLIKPQAGKSKMKMHASWLHKGDPYLTIAFMTGEDGGYIFYFPLDDLSKVSVSQEIPVEGGHRREIFEFSKTEKKAIQNGVFRSKKSTGQDAPGEGATPPDPKAESRKDPEL